MDIHAQIDEIMDYFNFARVRKTMEALDWIWSSAENGVPSETEIRIVARRLLREVILGKYSFVSTGGLTASIEHAKLSLRFDVAEWTAGE